MRGLRGLAIWPSTLLLRWVCAVSGEPLWLHDYQGTGRHSFAVVEGGGIQRAGRCRLELQAGAYPPHKSASGHCPQRLSTWMSLLCCRDPAAKVPEGLLCFMCKLCHELQLLGNQAAPFYYIAIDRCRCVFFAFQLLHLFSRNWTFDILPITKDQNTPISSLQWIEFSLTTRDET